MRNEHAFEPGVTRAFSYSASVVALLVLLAVAGMLVYGLVRILLIDGMENSLLWAVLGALTFALVALYTFACRPAPLANLWRGFSSLAVPLGVAGKSLLGLAAICLLGVCLAFPHGHVPPYDELPILSSRTHYVLEGGPNGLFEVSRLRYLLAAVCFHVGWHSAFLGSTLMLLKTLCQGLRRNHEN